MRDGIKLRTWININEENKEAVVQLARQLYTIGGISEEGLSSIEDLANQSFLYFLKSNT